MNDDQLPEFLTESWWPSSVGDPSDLPRFSGERWAHVAEHLRANIEHTMAQGDTAFNPIWGPDRIGQAASQVLRKAARIENTTASQLRGNRYQGMANIEGIQRGKFSVRSELH